MANVTSDIDDRENLIQAAREFFSKCPEEELPLVLKSKGSWTVLHGDWFWALFYLNDASLQRIREYNSREWHPFPGLFSPTESNPAHIPLEGKDYFLDSNMTQNGYAFRVGRRATCIMQNHFHSVIDPQGNEAAYRVDLAFVVGVDAAMESQDLVSTFRHLFNKYLKILSNGR